MKSKREPKASLISARWHKSCGGPSLVPPFNRSLGCLFASLSLLLAVTFAPAAQAQDAAGAGVLFTEAKALADAGDYAAACPKFQASLDLDPSLGTRLNLANCLQEVGKFGSAKSQWELAAKEAKERQDERVPYIAEQLALVSPKVPTLVVEVVQGPEVLSVHLAGKELTSSKWGLPMDLDPGDVVVEVLRADQLLETKSVKLLEGKAERLSLDLAAIAKAHPLPKKKVVEPVDPTQRIAGIVVMSVGFAGIAAFGVLEAAALGIRSSANEPDQCYSGAEGAAVCSPDGFDTIQLSGDLAEVGQWVGVGGVGVAAIGLTVLLTAPSDAPPDSQSYLVPVLSPSFAGLAYGGTF
jgi:hypothetical protein